MASGSGAGPWDRLVRSAWNYRVAFVSDLVAPAGWLVFGVRRAHGLSLEAVTLSVVGFCACGWLEYAVHRWVFHGPFPALRRSHARHHAEPDQLYSAPLGVILGTSFIVFAAFAAILPPPAAAFLVFGLYLGYNYFAVLHHLQHHAQRTLARVGPLRRLEQFHDRHHRRPGVNFGITTTIWDKLFGTTEKI